MGKIIGYKHGESSVDKVDPRLWDIVQHAIAAQPYDAVIRSGAENRGKAEKGNHGGGYAIDVTLYNGKQPLPDEMFKVDRHGKPVSVVDGAPEAYKAYEAYAQAARVYQQQAHPELNDVLRWGGGFYQGGTPIDMMHLDITPNAHGAMALYSWANGPSSSATTLVGKFGTSLQSNGGGLANPRRVSQIRQQLTTGPLPPADIPVPVPAQQSVALAGQRAFTPPSNAPVAPTPAPVPSFRAPPLPMPRPEPPVIPAGPPSFRQAPTPAPIPSFRQAPEIGAAAVPGIGLEKSKFYESSPAFAAIEDNIADPGDIVMGKDGKLYRWDQAVGKKWEQWDPVASLGIGATVTGVTQPAMMSRNLEEQRIANPGINGETTTRAVVPGTPATNFNTKLPPHMEQSFQLWKKLVAPNDNGVDYDYRGAFAAGIQPDPATGHWPNTFKKPTEPTFSNESQYAKFAPTMAGSWNGDTYVPPAVSLEDRDARASLPGSNAAVGPNEVPLGPDGEPDVLSMLRQRSSAINGDTGATAMSVTPSLDSGGRHVLPAESYAAAADASRAGGLGSLQDPRTSDLLLPRAPERPSTSGNSLPASFPSTDRSMPTFRIGNGWLQGNGMPTAPELPAQADDAAAGPLDWASFSSGMDVPYLPQGGLYRDGSGPAGTVQLPRDVDFSAIVPELPPAPKTTRTIMQEVANPAYAAWVAKQPAPTPTLQAGQAFTSTGSIINRSMADAMRAVPSNSVQMPVAPPLTTAPPKTITIPKVVTVAPDLPKAVPPPRTSFTAPELPSTRGLRQSGGYLYRQEADGTFTKVSRADGSPINSADPLTQLKTYTAPAQAGAASNPLQQFSTWLTTPLWGGKATPAASGVPAPSSAQPAAAQNPLEALGTWLTTPLWGAKAVPAVPAAVAPPATAAAIVPALRALAQRQAADRAASMAEMVAGMGKSGDGFTHNKKKKQAAAAAAAV